MYIGSLPSVMRLAKVLFTKVLSSMCPLMLLLSISCTSEDIEEEEPSIFADDVADCGDLCHNQELSNYSGKSIHVEVEETTQAPQIFFNISPENLANGLALDPVFSISGKALGIDQFLKIEEKAEKKQLSSFADIIAIPIGNKISLPLRTPIKTRVLDDQSFSLSLPAGGEYALILNPSGLHHRAPLFLEPGIISKDMTLNFDLTAPFPKLLARIASKDTSILAAAEAPKVRAKVVQGNRLISSIEEVKNDGSISLEISPSFNEGDNVPVMLVIEPQDSESALPRLKVKLSKKALQNNIDVGTIDLGSLKAPLEAGVEIIDSHQSGIGNAIIFMKAKVGSGTSLIKKQVDSSGITVFKQLYEGSYDIAVIPPFDSPFGIKLIKNIEFLASKQSNVITIELHKREPLYGTVLDYDDKEVQGAQIELSRIGNIGDFATEDIFDDMLFKITATTNEEGRICQRRFGFGSAKDESCSPLTLDEGRYQAHIIPPPGSKLAHQWLSFDFPKTSTLAIKLVPPEILTGKILAADKNTPLARVFVTIYSTEPGLAKQAKVIANAITDEQGVFRAFIAPN